uniref:IMS import disulfide relay-system CHCH-CHCH-like Cx9C domain-containing protein n=1 Tax=Theileria annulata TaxID=5874 RepID=A0A3B0MPV8_THEAN
MLNDDRKCSKDLNEYYKCLSSSGRDPSKCQTQEIALRKCSTTDKENDYCLNELLELYRCTKKPDANGCANEFLLFRECNRPGGPEILVKDEMYKVNLKHLDKYNLSSNVICPVNPPKRSMKNISKLLEQMKQVCGFKNFQEKFTPQVKS